MASNTFGTLFSITTWGESHGKAIGVTLDGCPAGLAITEQEIQAELDRRRPGNNPYTSAREEQDRAIVLSGIEDGLTLGSPITILIENHDARPKDYQALQSLYRPSHADFVYEKKYGITSSSGGGRASARETATRVAAGAIAKKWLKEHSSIDIIAYVDSVGPYRIPPPYSPVSRPIVEASLIRCPDPTLEPQMLAYIQQAQNNGDSVGGTIQCTAYNVPVGLGEPVFEKLEANLAKAMLSIPACKGFESGSGFTGAALLGSQNNDTFTQNAQGEIQQTQNNSGGIIGGISNGEPIYFRVAFKPPSTIRKIQMALTREGKVQAFSGTGRHDPCVLPRAVPIVEAMTALVLADHLLIHKASAPKHS